MSQPNLSSDTQDAATPHGGSDDAAAQNTVLPHGAGGRKSFMGGTGKLVVTGIVVGVLVLLAAWSGYAYWQLHRSASHFAAHDYAAAEKSARSFLRVSPFEQHKGHFGIGTALAADGDLDAGEAELLTALSKSPIRDECAVRINLALVQESQGDAFRTAEDVDAANDRYDTARTTLEEAPEECREPGSEEDGQMTSQEERVGESQEEMNNPSSDDGGDSGGDGSSTGGDDTTTGGDDQTGGSSGGSSGDDGQGSTSGSGGDTPGDGSSEKETDERMKELEERRRESEERHSQTNGGGSGSGVREPGAKPW